MIHAHESSRHSVEVIGAKREKKKLREINTVDCRGIMAAFSPEVLYPSG